MNQDEHNLQCACVRWFRYQHRDIAPLLFAVPNGGARSKATAGKLKAEGVVPGVADLLLLVPSGNSHGLAIEMKTQQGRQSKEQHLWQIEVEKKGYKYAIVRSLDEFVDTVTGYMREIAYTTRPV